MSITMCVADIGRPIFSGGSSGNLDDGAETEALDEDGELVFSSPLGDGTTLGLSSSPCLELEVAVEAPEGAEVTLSLDDPVIDGADFVQQSDTTATLSWCPSEVQLRRERYTLTFLADDGPQVPVDKTFLVVLRS